MVLVPLSFLQSNHKHAYKNKGVIMKRKQGA